MQTQYLALLASAILVSSGSATVVLTYTDAPTNNGSNTATVSGTGGTFTWFLGTQTDTMTGISFDLLASVDALSSGSSAGSLSLGGVSNTAITAGSAVVGVGNGSQRLDTNQAVTLSNLQLFTANVVGGIATIDPSSTLTLSQVNLGSFGGATASIDGVSFNDPLNSSQVTIDTADGLTLGGGSVVVERSSGSFFLQSNSNIDGIVTINTVVPEPSSVALLGLGTLGIFARRRR